jgi:hypothetical protein
LVQKIRLRINIIFFLFLGLLLVQFVSVLVRAPQNVRGNWGAAVVLVMFAIFLPLLLQKDKFEVHDPGKYLTPRAQKAWKAFQEERAKKLEHTHESAKLAVDSRLDPSFIFFVFPFITSIFLVLLMPNVPLPVTVGRVFSLIFLALGLLSLLHKRIIDDTPTLKTMGVFIGQVELKGTAESENPLTSYITGTKCVQYSWKVEEQNEIMQWIIVSSGGESSTFYLMDDTGALRIDPRNALLLTDTALKVSVDRNDPLYYDKSPRSSELRGRTRIFTETLIPLHAPLYVIGHARERQDRVAAEIAYDEEEPLFVISTRGEKQVSSVYRNQFISLFALGYIISILVPWSFGASTIRINLFSSIIFVAALILGWLLAVYNSLVNLRNIVDQAWSMIDIQLKRRSDLIPNLVEIIEGYREYEEEIQIQITTLRGQSMNQDNLIGVSSLLQSVAESYPELKAVQQFLELQRSLEDTEQRIALARDHYNQQTRFYNTRLEVVPDMFVARLGGLKPRQYWVAENFNREPEEIDFAS